MRPKYKKLDNLDIWLGFYLESKFELGIPKTNIASKVKNRNNIPIHASIYIKFGTIMGNIVRNMLIKF